jgi:hypothetical protein
MMPPYFADGSTRTRDGDSLGVAPALPDGTLLPRPEAGAEADELNEAEPPVLPTGGGPTAELPGGSAGPLSVLPEEPWDRLVVAEPVGADEGVRLDSDEVGVAVGAGELDGRDELGAGCDELGAGCDELGAGREELAGGVELADGAGVEWTGGGKLVDGPPGRPMPAQLSVMSPDFTTTPSGLITRTWYSSEKTATWLNLTMWLSG